MIVLLSVLFSSIAAITGILAIGSGRHWQFDIADYFRGKRNAILYAWVTSSTIFSILHSGVLIEYGLNWNWGFRTPDASKWFFLHAAMGLLLTAAHLFVASTLSKEVGPVDKFLWGNKRRAI
jgi:hypothetical protein